MDHLCYSCLVFVMLSRLFIAALWSSEGKGLTSWLLFVIFNVILLLFPFCILGQVWYLIVSNPDPCCLSYLDISYCFYLKFLYLMQYLNETSQICLTSKVTYF